MRTRLNTKMKLLDRNQQGSSKLLKNDTLLSAGVPRGDVRPCRGARGTARRVLCWRLLCHPLCLQVLPFRNLKLKQVSILMGMAMIRTILKIPTPSFLQRWLEGLLHNLLLARSSLQSGRAGLSKTHQYKLKATICKTWLPQFWILVRARLLCGR